jgi:hypothetical protein
MQEFFSILDVFFDARMKLYVNKNESFSTALLKIFNFSAKTGAYLFSGDFCRDFKVKTLKNS